MHSNPGHEAVEAESATGPRLGTAKGLFFLAAGLSLVASVYFYFTGDHERGIFVGIWVPSILSAGSLLMAGHSHD